MRQHDLSHDPTVKVDITELVHTHKTRHPGSVQHSVKSQERKKNKRAKTSRKTNR